MLKIKFILKFIFFKSLLSIGALISSLRNFFNILSFLFDIIYSGFIKSSFGYSGSNFVTKFPFYVIGGKKITIGNNFSSFRRNRIEVFGKILDNDYSGKLIIGDNFSMNDDCHIACINKITIGNDVLFASKIFITDHLHGKTNLNSLFLPPRLRPLFSKGEVIIKDNVWVGEGVVILPGVTISENCIIGANSVVTKSFPRNSVIGGNPAKVIRTIYE
jgi:acetyltransferase-like isoleucine patch superfamily enzyme